MWTFEMHTCMGCKKKNECPDRPIIHKALKGLLDGVEKNERGPGRSYYQHTFTEDDHKRLSEVLRRISDKFILSYDDHPSVRKLYRKFKVKNTEPVQYSMNNRLNSPARKVSELIITNF